MAEREHSQYTMDILGAIAERTIKRLWILLVIVTLLLFGSNVAWVIYESQFETVVVTQDVEQDATDGTNHFIGGDYYGTAESEDNG